MSLRIFTLCVLSYATFVLVIFLVKEIAVRSEAFAKMREIHSFETEESGNTKARVGGMVAGRRMFENKGH